jgi:ferredoxin
MEGNGPASPDLREVGLVLAADNGVALDAVIATLMGCEPARLRFLRRAQELGLGEYDLGQIEIEGELKPIPNFKLPPFSGEAILNNAAMQAAMDQRIRVRPKADESLCTGCGTCVDQCPVSALSLEEALPRVDPETCIGCFCCQELCPERAMALS